jgi:hypothetical protein
MDQTEELIEAFLDWKHQRKGKPLGETTRRRYRATLLRLAAAKGSLLRVTTADLRTHEASRRIGPRAKGVEQSAYREFFEFAMATRRRRDNPTKDLRRPETIPKRSRAFRQWGGVPKRNLLPKVYRPVFDFLREVWGRYPELTLEEIHSINAPGRVPEVVELREGKHRGLRIMLSPKARFSLQDMGGSFPREMRAMQRAFNRAYGGAFKPTALKHLPPPGFGLDLHTAFEGEVRDLIEAGKMEDAARRAWIQVEERIRALVRSALEKDGNTRPLIEEAFAHSGVLAHTVPPRPLEPTRMFLSGALGVFRNEVAHHIGTLGDEDYALEIVVVADAIMRFLDPIEAKATKPSRDILVSPPKLMSEARLRRLSDMAFERWAIQALNGVPAAHAWQTLGIDGFTVNGDCPIQVKRRDNVQRDSVDSFETAVGRYGSSRGILVAFSFTRGARDEADRVKQSDAIAIELATAADLLARLRRTDNNRPA